MATNGQTTAKTAKQSYEELAAMLAAAQAKLAQTSALRFKVSEKRRVVLLRIRPLPFDALRFAMGTPRSDRMPQHNVDK